MRNKKSQLVWYIFSFVLISTQAQANVLLNQTSAYPQHTMGQTGYTISFAGNATGTPQAGSYYDSNSYRFINTQTDRIWVDVSTDAPPTGSGNLAVSLQTGSSTNNVPLTAAGTITGDGEPVACNATTCPLDSGGNHYSWANYTAGSVMRLSFSIVDLCAADASISSVCTSGSVNGSFTGTSTISLKVNFNMISASGSGYAATAGSSTVTGSFVLSITDTPPSITCPTSSNPADYYFPGDQEIYITPGQYPTSDNTGADVRYIWMFANRGGSVQTFSTNALPINDLDLYLNASGGRVGLSGFVNSTTGSDNGYTGAFYAQNSAGIFSSPCSPLGSIQFFAQPVSGVLTESKCFIATAAYHDGRAAPVMMLRKFRDDVLTQSHLGRSFIENYYKYSPALAEWAWDKPIIRSIALKLLTPVELIAWAVLKISGAEENSNQPYIDRVKKKLEVEGQPTESYSEQEKRRLIPEEGKAENEGSYSEKLKQELGESEKSDGYSADVKKGLADEKERPSQIDAVKEGRDKLPRPERPDIKNAVSFKFGVNPGVGVTNSAGTATFQTIYGAGFQPDFQIHFERQFFHSENWGSLAFGGDLGASYAEGFGQLKFAFNGTTVSATKMSFIQSPLMVDAYYRFNLLRILRPYVGVATGVMGYTEIRQDKRADQRGYSFIYSEALGVSLLLDYFDSSTALQGYLANGIQHTYLFVEYYNLSSFETSGVTFARNGIYSGFLFEF